MALSYELKIMLNVPKGVLKRQLEDEKTKTVFVNDDYEEMSNSMIRYYTGPHRHLDSELKEDTETDEEFFKWLL